MSIYIRDTTLGLPRRVTGLQIPRREYQQFSESFPALLDALERYADDRLAGIDLGVIEWYHRIRNELYHQGNGLTVERDKVEVYAELANALFKSLFDIELVESPSGASNPLGDFIEVWVELEKSLVSIAHDHSPTGAHGMSLLHAARFLRGTDLVTSDDIVEFEQLGQLRNKVVHGAVEPRDAITPEVLSRLRALRDRFKELDGG